MPWLYILKVVYTCQGILTVVGVRRPYFGVGMGNGNHPQTAAEAIALYETKAQAPFDACRQELAKRPSDTTLLHGIAARKAMRSYVQLDLGKRGPNPGDIDTLSTMRDTSSPVSMTPKTGPSCALIR